MLTAQTSIVLGAGASVDFGFPLAEELHEVIPRSLAALDAAMRGERRHSASRVGTNNASAFARNPIVSLASYLLETEQPFSLSDFRDFRNSVTQQTHDSVDRFIVDNPRLAPLGKLLLAERILMKMYYFDGYAFKLRNFGDRKFGERRNWYHRLMNFVRGGANDDLVKNKLYIVTFNYDGTLECALDICFSQPERFRDVKWRDIIKPLHVNGGPTMFPDTIADVGKELVSWASTIQLIGEPPTEALSEIRNQARSAISNSNRVFVLGFQMDPSNVATIGLNQYPRKDYVFCHNFNGHEGINHRCRQIGISPSNMKSGTHEHPLFIDDLLTQMFLEQ